MDTIEILTPTSAPERLYCIWYVTAIEGEQLDDIKSEHQLHQDMMVVDASSDLDALHKAEELLKARCEFEFVITKVANREELERVLSTALGRVERGEVPPASLADADHHVWAERYVYCSEDSESSADTP